MGWELERFPEPNQELVCCICTGVVDDPVEIRCRHIFCNVCLKTWLKNRSSSHSRRAGTCPSCRATVKHRDIRSAPHMLKNIIGKQLIRCENKARGCMETPKLDDLISHQKNCMYAEVVCQTQGCKVAFMRKDSAKHAKSCPKRRILCEKGCSLEMFLSEIASHNCVAALKAHCTTVTNSLEERISRLEREIERITSDGNRDSSRRRCHDETADNWTDAFPSIPNRPVNRGPVDDDDMYRYHSNSPSAENSSSPGHSHSSFAGEPRDIYNDFNDAWQVDPDHSDSEYEEDEWW